jgi:hypothetical protein
MALADSVSGLVLQSCQWRYVCGSDVICEYDSCLSLITEKEYVGDYTLDY